jgi:hypothetical protein
MNEEFAKEILQELISSLETLETQTAAILQFLSDKKPANKKALAACLETAGQASSVRWRASRARIDHLLSSVMKSVEEEARKEAPKPKAASQEEEAGREKKTSQRPDDSKPAKSEEEEESKTKQAEEQNGQEPTTSETAQGEKPETKNADASANRGEDDQPEPNGDSRNEGKEGKHATDTNRSDTDGKEKAA